MENEFLLSSLFQILFAIVTFVVLVYVGGFILNKVESTSRFKNSRFANPLEYLPFEEIMSLKQVFYLIMILVFIIISLYLLFDWKDGLYFISGLDIVISIYLAVKMNKSSFKDKIILFLLIPFGSITGAVFGDTIIVLFDIFHIIGYIYFIKVYYRKFVEYTENNGLGITIILLFSIILVSFLFTIIVEDVSPLDSMTMVSNAFTSNSFDASGKITLGKLNSLLLAWGGFILSGVGTATLSVSIVMKYINREFNDVKDLIKKKKK